MTKVVLKYIGAHQEPHTVEVDINKVKEYMSTGEYIIVTSDDASQIKEYKIKKTKKNKKEGEE